MFSIDVDQPITHEEIAREFQRPQTPIVQAIDLAETTFSDQSLLARSSREAVGQQLGEENRLEPVQTVERSGVSFADEFIRKALSGIALKLEDEGARETFSTDGLSTRELMRVLDYAASDDLLNFTGTLFTLSLVDSDLHNFVVDKIDNALYYLNVFEKRDLIEGLLEQGGNPRSHGMILHVFRSCEDMDEISDLVEGLGKRELLATGDAQIMEYVAQAIVGPQVRAVRFPERLDEKISPLQLRGVLSEIRDGVTEVIEICKRFPEFSETQVIKDYLDTAQDDLRHLSEEINEQQVLRPTPPQEPPTPVVPAEPELPDTTALEGNPELAASNAEKLAEYEIAIEAYNEQMLEYGQAMEGFQEASAEYEKELAQYHKDVVAAEKALRAIANVYREACELEFEYGVNITYGESQYLGRESGREVGSREGRWSERDIQDIREVLESIPEGHLLSSPLLREIQRVASLGSGVFAARFQTGIVKVSDKTIDSDYVRDAYEGKSPLMMVLMHELGHGVQIGNGPSWIRTNDDGSQVIEIGERIYDFDEYMKISGWEIVDRARWSGGGWLPLMLDGVRVEVGTPIEHDGKRMVLVPMGPDVLMTYNPDSEFSHDDYSHATPWEDFAEAFSEYMFLPERLIKHAPQKFMHLENEFRKYEHNHKLLELAEAGLRGNP